MIDLKAIAGSRWRVTLDESAEQDPGGSHSPWNYRLEGRRGHVYCHGQTTLGVWTDHRGMRRRLLDLLGARLHQGGDREWTIVVSLDHLGAAATIIKARKRRRLSEEHRAKLGSAGSKSQFSALPAIRTVCPV